jgi:CheY-like chemotaxis protein
MIMPISNTARPDRRPVVLLVEDDADSREMYATMLEFAGIDVHVAGEAAAAFDLAVALAPDVIVTDFMLRGPENGAALCRRLHADERTSRIPVLVVTGSTRLADTEALSGAGCADIRLKPYLPDALVSDIWRLLTGPGRGRAVRAS